jgi:hypothetical protein
LKERFGEYSEKLKCSLELAMSYLYLKALDAKAKDINHMAFIRILDLLIEVIAKTTNQVKTGSRSIGYRFILSELKRLKSPKDLTIITFNYDLIIERILDGIAKTTDNKNSFAFPGCYRLQNVSGMGRIKSDDVFSNPSHTHEGVAVLKLHGSMNWVSKHTSYSPNPSALFKPNRELHIAYNTNIQSGITLKKKRVSYLKPIIVPPVSGKRNMMHKEILPLWNIASKALKEADRVIIVGYSCPPLDIEARILISESLQENKNKKIYVIDPNTAAASKFIELSGVNHSTVYTSIKNWIEDATKL